MKGKVGELELVHFFRDYGIEANRTQQFRGKGTDASDVVLKDFKQLHIECKRTEKFDLYGAIEQADRDALPHGKFPIVAHRRSHEPWVFVMKADTMLAFLLKFGFIEPGEFLEPLT